MLDQRADYCAFVLIEVWQRLCVRAVVVAVSRGASMKHAIFEYCVRLRARLRDKSRTFG
jgi:hypothetical protein